MTTLSAAVDRNRAANGLGVLSLRVELIPLAG